MARRVVERFRKLGMERPDLREALKKTNKQTSTRAYNKLRKLGVKPNISLPELRGMARRASKRSGIPVKISKDMTEGGRYADGVSIPSKRGVETRVHPVVQYYDRGYVKDLIGHELDHAKVQTRRLGLLKR